MLDWDNGEISITVLKISIKLLCFNLVQHMLHQIKAQQFYNDLGLYQLWQVLQKIVDFRTFQGIWVIFQYFSGQDFSRKPSKLKYFSSLYEPCVYVEARQFKAT